MSNWVVLLYLAVRAANVIVGLTYIATPKKSWIFAASFFTIVALTIPFLSSISWFADLPKNVILVIEMVLGSLEVFMYFCFWEKWYQVLALTLCLTGTFWISSFLIQGLFGFWGFDSILTPDSATRYPASVAAYLILISVLFSAIRYFKRRTFWKSAPKKLVIGIFIFSYFESIVLGFWYERRPLEYRYIHMIVVFSTIILTTIFLLDHQMEEKRKGFLLEQQSYYKNVLNNWNEIRVAQHNLQNNLQTAKLLSVQQSKQEQAFLTKIQDQIPTLYIWSDNPVINAVLHQKTVQDNDRDLPFEIDVCAGALETVEGLDIASLLANLLDNAYESAPPETTIRVFIRQKGNVLVIHIINETSCNNSDAIKIGVSKKRGTGHGLGLLSVQGICEKYDGSFSINKDDNGQVEAKAVLIVPDGSIGSKHRTKLPLR